MHAAIRVAVLTNWPDHQINSPTGAAAAFAKNYRQTKSIRHEYSVIVDNTTSLHGHDWGRDGSELSAAARGWRSDEVSRVMRVGGRVRRPISRARKSGSVFPENGAFVCYLSMMSVLPYPRFKKLHDEQETTIDIRCAGELSRHLLDHCHQFCG